MTQKTWSAEVDSGNIVIRGLRQNNLKNLALTVPKNKIVVFTGVSGSGKSSIVFDTIAAESQRQMNETYPAFVRSRLPKYEKPAVDSIENLTSAVIVEVSSWRHRADATNPQGAEVDLVIDRKDDVINLCEMKFHAGPFVIDKKYAAELAVKRQVFQVATKTRKSLYLTFVTTDGLYENEYSESIQSTVDLDALFVDIPHV